MAEAGVDAASMTVRMVRERLVGQFGDCAAKCDLVTPITAALEEQTTADPSDSSESDTAPQTSAKPAVTATSSLEPQWMHDTSSDSDAFANNRAGRSSAAPKSTVTSASGRTVRAKSFAGVAAGARAVVAKRRAQMITAAGSNSDSSGGGAQNSSSSDSDGDESLTPAAAARKKKQQTAAKLRAEKSKLKAARQVDGEYSEASADSDSSVDAGKHGSRKGKKSAAQYEDFGIDTGKKMRELRKADRLAVKQERAAARAAKKSGAKPGDRTAESVTAEELAVLNQKAQEKAAKRAAAIEALRMSNDEIRTLTAAQHASVMDKIRAKVADINQNLKVRAAAELARLIAEAKAEGQQAANDAADIDSSNENDVDMDGDAVAEGDGAGGLDQSGGTEIDTANGDDTSLSQVTVQTGADRGSAGTADVHNATTGNKKSSSATDAHTHGDSGNAMELDGDSSCASDSGSDGNEDESFELDVLAPTATQMLAPGESFCHNDFFICSDFRRCLVTCHVYQPTCTPAITWDVFRSCCFSIWLYACALSA